MPATYSTYNRTAIQIMTRALKLCRVIDPDLPLQATDRANAMDALNGFIKYLQTKGFNLWRETQAVIPMNQGQTRYQLGPNGDRFFDADYFAAPLLVADAVTGDTFLTLTTFYGWIDPDMEIQGAPELFYYDPTISLQDWTATDATLTADSTGLVVTNDAAAQGSASFVFETTPGITYRLTYDYIQGTSADADFSITDIAGVIITQNQVASGSYEIEFTARQNTSNFVIANGSAVITETSQVYLMSLIDMDAGDQIGIFLDTGDLFWTTVVTASNPTVELRAGLPSDAAANNQVYSYSEAGPRPLDIIQVQYRDNITASDIPTSRWTRDEYFDQPDKTSQGSTTKWYYSPQLDLGNLYIWQSASQLNSVLMLTYIRPLDVTEDNADRMDFPSEWYDLLSFGCAYRLSAEYKVPDIALTMIQTQYSEIFDSALGYDNDGDIKIQIDYQGRR